MKRHFNDRAQFILCMIRTASSGMPRGARERLRRTPVRLVWCIQGDSLLPSRRL